MVITCFHHSWSWSSKLVQFESGDGLTGNQMIQSEYRLVAMACAYFLEKQRKKVKPNLKLMALLDLHMNHGSRCWAIPCCYVDCMKCFKVQGKFIIPCSSKQQWRPALTPHNGIQHGTTSRLSKCVKTTPAYCIQQWHPAMARYWHPSMASSNGTPPHDTQQWHLTMAPSIQQWHPASSNGTHHGIQQWHLTTAPSNGTTSSLSKCVITTPRHLTTWHPAMAPDHGTQQWHHAQSVKVCHNHSPPQQWHPAPSNGILPHGTHHGIQAMAPYHGTQQWHHVQSVASSNGTQQRHLTTWHPAMASMQQWHRTMTPTMASYHGTLPWHPAMAPRLSPPIASSNGTQQWNLTTWHPAMPPYYHGT